MITRPYQLDEISLLDSRRCRTCFPHLFRGAGPTSIRVFVLLGMRAATRYSPGVMARSDRRISRNLFRLDGLDVYRGEEARR